MPQDFLDNRYQALVDLLRGMGRVLIAFSGGTDSTLLLKAAVDSLPPADVLAVTAVSPILPQRERKEASRQARRLGVRHMFWESGEMGDPEFTRNSPERCYVCSRRRFAGLRQLARENQCGHVLDGQNQDDEADFRPGARAARELGVRSPLREVGLAKADIRRLSRRLGLSTWNKPASACLASRIAYHSPVTVEKLAQVEAGEAFLHGLKISRQIRVRHHGDIARLEVAPEDLHQVVSADCRRRIGEHFRSLGFLFVAVDLEGYRTGSLNRTVADTGP